MRIVAGLLCMLLVAACSEKDKIPSGVIGKEEMEKILWDMMLADQYSANYLVKDSARVNVKMETLKLYEEVFRLHKVSRDEFRKSFQFYQERPDITRTMFDSLLAKGNRARIENYTRPPATPPVVPSAGKAGDTIRARTIGPPVLRPRTTPPAKVSGTSSAPPGQFPVSFPHRPGTIPPGKPGFLPARPLKAGEAPFKQVKKDSVTKGRQ
ncbi:DUF4296 domain-containing protein [Flavitalea sp. BT771]|uniref:DUF4296 domain-containing protein n=1 Tax=Flavitalea sp. BT771 TaxID=3063329 RepID=UPI0026E1ED7D|nr:DUF4296 domain-containing protein [Flavitalea sp. BT771]MDO6429685.1 DUF4296 domain-containing protein [Flavitalea sp. BT771]MDV6218187.1 DUF4296 domain-containing protein [Flavitalea sp. BT771]